MSLLAKGSAAYEKLRKVYHLPTRVHLLKYRASSAEERDGLLFGVLSAFEDQAKGARLEAGQCLGALCFDSMKLREGLYWDATNQSITGFDSDAFAEPDVMKLEFARQARTATQGKPGKLDLAKDYLVF